MQATRPRIRKGSMFTYYGGERAYDEAACIIALDPTTRSLRIAYDQDGRGRAYTGEEEVGRPGHWQVTLIEGGSIIGRGTLHSDREDMVFEGWWNEDRAEGMWRIECQDPDDE